jgi:FemAB-related protein (PEP-CTERM system-associated)
MVQEPRPQGAPEVVPYSGTDDEWDRMMSGFADSTFCHLSGWERVMSGALGHECIRLGARDDSGAWVGGLPLVHVRSRLFGDYLLSMPFLSYGGPVGPTEARQLLVETAIEEADRRGVDLLELRSRQALPGDHRVSERKVTVVKSLPESSEELWEKGLRAKVRSQVRRPMKEGMTTRFGPELVSSFYGVFARTMRDLGTPVLPRAFFEAIVENLSERSVVGLVELDGRPVAAGFGLEWNGELEITWAGADRELSRLAPNMLLYWGFMEESIRRGATAFNFGRCTPGSGTHRFKMQWGAEEQPLPWIQWAPSDTLATPSPDDSKYQLATRVWSRLPLAVTNFIGPRISRFLP